MPTTQIDALKILQAARAEVLRTAMADHKFTPSAYFILNGAIDHIIYRSNCQ